MILDGVYNDVKNARIEAERRQGMEMGFDGKTLIHPSQVDLANEMWAPSAAEVEYAERSSPPSMKGSRTAVAS